MTHGVTVHHIIECVESGATFKTPHFDMVAQGWLKGAYILRSDLGNFMLTEEEAMDQIAFQIKSAYAPLCSLVS